MNANTEPTQLDKFQVAAQEAECDMEEAAFDNIVAGLATAEKENTHNQEKDDKSD